MSVAGAVGGVLGALIIIGGLGACAYIAPQYGVYSAEASGRAQLAEAESNRRIRVLEAQAALDSAELTSQAEIARARGVAEANQILSSSLGGPEHYLRWRYIEMLESTASGTSVIYVPTEAGLPILEAGHRPE